MIILSIKQNYKRMKKVIHSLKQLKGIRGKLRESLTPAKAFSLETFKSWAI